jgi:predicted GH43/DUF377 family glycosyl hydrolase
MKKKSLLFTLCLMLFLFGNYTLKSQENWEKYENNPVLTTGDEAMWDEYGVSMGAVLKFDNQYHLWYNGRMSEISNWQIGYAWSDDGINWTKYPFPVITYGTFGNWDNYRRLGAVIRVNDTLKMWFVATKDMPFEMQLGYAWSTDGISWHIHPEPVLSNGQDGAWDDFRIFEPSVVYTGGEYHMWYSGYDDEDYTPKIGYASSVDGIYWVKDVENNPVLEGGIEGSYIEEWVCFPNVLRIDGMFKMWFSGHDVFEHYRIGYAESENGIEWDYITEEPVLTIGANETWDDIMVCHPSVMIDNNQYKMWYSGNDGSRYKIGLALGDITTKIDNHQTVDAFYCQSYPNPFTNKFELHYYLDIKSQVIISLIDSRGCVIKTLKDEFHLPGDHVATFDANDLKTGVYYYRFQISERIAVGKILKL